MTDNPVQRMTQQEYSPHLACDLPDRQLTEAPRPVFGSNHGEHAISVS